MSFLDTIFYDIPIQKLSKKMQKKGVIQKTYTILSCAYTLRVKLS